MAEGRQEVGGPPVVAGGMSPAGSGVDMGLLARKETQDLVRAYYRIPDTEVRKRVLDLIRSMVPAE